MRFSHIFYIYVCIYITYLQVQIPWVCIRVYLGAFGTGQLSANAQIIPWNLNSIKNLQFLIPLQLWEVLCDQWSFRGSTYIHYTYVSCIYIYIICKSMYVFMYYICVYVTPILFKCACILRAIYKIHLVNRVISLRWLGPAIVLRVGLVISGDKERERQGERERKSVCVCVKNCITFNAF